MLGQGSIDYAGGTYMQAYWLKPEKILSLDTYTNSEDNPFVVAFTLTNTGATAKQLIINGGIQNVVGYEHVFDQKVQLLPPNEQLIISYFIDDLPWYRGAYSVDVDVQHMPQFASLNYVHADEGELHLVSSFFVMPWLIIALGLCMMIFVTIRKLLQLFFLFREKKKKR